jgi:membrane protein DedA with SNARE-associated domain
MQDIGQLIVQYGLALIFANVLLDQLGFPAPAVPALLVAGALAADGRLSAPEIFAVSVVATLIADSVWYVAGRRYGNGVMKVLCRVSLTPDACVSQTQVSFERWGANALVIAKFIPGLAVIAFAVFSLCRIQVVGEAPFLQAASHGANKRR